MAETSTMNMLQALNQALDLYLERGGPIYNP